MTHLKIGDEVIVKVLEGHVDYDFIKTEEEGKFHKGKVMNVSSSGNFWVELDKEIHVRWTHTGRNTRLAFLKEPNWDQLIVIKRVSSPAYSKVFWSGKGKKKVKTMTEQHTLGLQFSSSLEVLKLQL